MPLPHFPATTVGSAALKAAGVTCIERGWLSANNILLQGNGPTALVDSGYASHETQTVALVRAALGETPLDLLLNTHLHSDHCGGNAALQHAYPALETWIPPGQANSVTHWDPIALTFEPTGQFCPRFTHQATLNPGETVRLGSWNWEIHAAKGHDPHSIILFQPHHRLLMSADALWENGFGIVFPELEGLSAFQEVADTLQLIERLDPATVLPGHGAVFHDVKSAIARARSRLDQFVKHPEKHKRHALKVLVKFKMLEWQTVPFPILLDWITNTSYFQCTMPQEALVDQEATRQWIDELLQELVASGALCINGDAIANR